MQNDAAFALESDFGGNSKLLYGRGANSAWNGDLSTIGDHSANRQPLLQFKDRRDAIREKLQRLRCEVFRAVPAAAGLAHARVRE
jgi:hypothetical protein